MNRRQFSLLLLILFSLLTVRSAAQQGKQELYGSWVKTKITYANGDELPEEDPVKCGYLKLIFAKPNMMGLTNLYNNRSTSFSFDISNGDILMKSPEGVVVSKFHILSLTNKKLVLLRLGFPAADNSFRYSFVREEAFQNSLPLTSFNIFMIRHNDTIYSECPKMYASCRRGDFPQFLNVYIENDKYIRDKNIRFLAIFTVSKDGVADSVKILQGIDPDFDKQFVKAFNKTRKRWEPAVLNGKKVAVEMSVHLGHYTTNQVVAEMDYSAKANNAYRQMDFKAALYFFNEGLKLDPQNITELFERGICEEMLGDMSDACQDWRKVKELGGMEADGVLAKYCD